MPVLDNPRHERFAQALAKGLPASRAYVEAGYAQNDANAGRLKQNEQVRGRVAELQTEAAKSVGYTVESLSLKLEDALKLAQEVGSPAAAVSAVMGIAKLNGLLVDKTEVSGNIDIGSALQAARRRARLRNTSDDMSGDIDGETSA